jgi:hypothetical protein
MQQAAIMSLDDKLGIILKSIELEKQGKIEEAEHIHKQLPLPPYLAKWAKKRMGASFLINQGFNLTEAEAEYGPDWLNN